MMAEVRQAASNASKTAETSQIQGNVDVESELRQQLSAMQTQLDEAKAEIERLRAAAVAPCPRCNIQSKWSVRVRTMAGQVHTINCPDGPWTQIHRIKKDLARFDPKFYIQQQLTLVLPCEADDADQTGRALADVMTLASCGVSNGDLLDLFLVDMDWSEEDLMIIEDFKHLTKDYSCIELFDDDSVLPLSWALVNAVCPTFESIACLFIFIG